MYAVLKTYRKSWKQFFFCYQEIWGNGKEFYFVVFLLSSISNASLRTKCLVSINDLEDFELQISTLDWTIQNLTFYKNNRFVSCFSEWNDAQCEVCIFRRLPGVEQTFNGFIIFME